MQYNIDTIKSQIESKEVWFCPRPFDHIYNNVDGNYAVCCVGTGTGVHSANVSPVDWMNSDDMVDLRVDMLTKSGKDSPLVNRICAQCKKAEKNFGNSERTRFVYNHKNKLKDKLEPVLSQAIDAIVSGEWKPIERCLYIQLRHFGNQCNLDCYMCHPRNSSTRVKQDEIHNTAKLIRFDPQDYDMTSNFDDLNNTIIAMAPYISDWSIQGGEPLVMRNQYKLLDKLIKTGHTNKINLTMNTNATVLASGKHRILSYFDKFKNVYINLSIDSVGEYNNYIRKRSEWKDINNNIKILQTVPNVHLEVLCVLSTLSILRFDLLLKWGLENNIKIKTTVLEEPPELMPCHLPLSIKKKIINKHADNEIVTAALSQNGNEDMFEKAIAYCKANDKAYRGTKWEAKLSDVFPELKEYYENNIR